MAKINIHKLVDGFLVDTLLNNLIYLGKHNSNVGPASRVIDDEFFLIIIRKVSELVAKLGFDGALYDILYPLASKLKHKIKSNIYLPLYFEIFT